MQAGGAAATLAGGTTAADGVTEGASVTDGPPQAVTMSDNAAQAARYREKDIAMEYRIGLATTAVAS